MLPPTAGDHPSDIVIRAGAVVLPGYYSPPRRNGGLVVFAQGGGARDDTVNQALAAGLRRTGLGTLLFDLLTVEEEERDAGSGRVELAVGLLAERLALAVQWAAALPGMVEARFGYFGAGTGAAAAAIAAADDLPRVRALVIRGGRPDLAGAALERLEVPTMLLVGGDDREGFERNRDAFARIRAEKCMQVIPGASPAFAEPGKLETVADLAGGWFLKHLGEGGGQP